MRPIIEFTPSSGESAVTVSSISAQRSFITTWLRINQGAITSFLGSYHRCAQAGEQRQQVNAPRRVPGLGYPSYCVLVLGCSPSTLPSVLASRSGIAACPVGRKCSESCSPAPSPAKDQGTTGMTMLPASMYVAGKNSDHYKPISETRGAASHVPGSF